MFPANAVVSAATLPFWLAVATSRPTLTLVVLPSPSRPTLRPQLANRFTPSRLGAVKVISGAGGS